MHALFPRLTAMKLCGRRDQCSLHATTLLLVSELVQLQVAQCVKVKRSLWGREVHGHQLTFEFDRPCY